MGGSGGGSTGSEGGSTAFSRAGTAAQTNAYSLPSALSSLLNSSMQMYGGTDDQAKTFLHKMVNQDSTLPGNTNLATVANGLNPLSTTYETDTQNQFDNRLQKMLAVSRTGMENANAPLNRGKEYREAEVISQGTRDRPEELRKQRFADFGMLQGANSTMLGQGNQAAEILQRLKMSNVAGAGAMGELLGSKASTTTENFSGQGNQSNTAYSMGGGMGFNLCCFIFLEALNGKLPWWVRACRDEFITPRRRLGYVWMSRWLVPLMQRNRLARWLTNTLMIQPLMKWGGWYKHVKGYESYAYLKPFVVVWFRVWDEIGKRV